MRYIKTQVDQDYNIIKSEIPEGIKLPGYRMFEHKSREIQAKSRRIEISLKHIAEKAKKNEYVYANLAESMFDEGSNWSYDSYIYKIISIGGVILTIINTLCRENFSLSF